MSKNPEDIPTYPSDISTQTGHNDCDFFRDVYGNVRDEQGNTVVGDALDLIEYSKKDPTDTLPRQLAWNAMYTLSRARDPLGNIPVQGGRGVTDTTGLAAHALRVLKCKDCKLNVVDKQGKGKEEYIGCPGKPELEETVEIERLEGVWDMVLGAHELAARYWMRKAGYTVREFAAITGSAEASEAAIATFDIDKFVGGMRCTLAEPFRNDQLPSALAHSLTSTRRLQEHPAYLIQFSDMPDDEITRTRAVVDGEKHLPAEFLFVDLSTANRYSGTLPDEGRLGEIATTVFDLMRQKNKNRVPHLVSMSSNKLIKVVQRMDGGLIGETLTGGKDRGYVAVLNAPIREADPGNGTPALYFAGWIGCHGNIDLERQTGFYNTVGLKGQELRGSRK